MRGLLVLLAAGLVLGGCGRRQASAPPTERQQQIGRLQDFAREKGFPETGNFRTADPELGAWYLCYFAKPLELPDSYDGLGYKESKRPDCGVNARKVDVYLHRTESVAFEDAPVTASLEQATEERALMVAAHEEAHEDPQLERLPHPVAEAATTLLGMLTAAAFAQREGDMVTATRLSGDAVLYAKKARLVNELHARLKALYGDVRRKRVSATAALAQKETLFAEAAQACGKLGTGHSINPCLPVSNNAGLAFDHSYTRFYPRMYALYEACGMDLDRFLAVLRKLGEGERRDLAAIERRIAGLVEEAAGGGRE